MLKYIPQIRVKLSSLHLAEFEITVLIIPNNGSFLHLDLRPLSFVFITLHDHSNLLNPSAIYHKYFDFIKIMLKYTYKSAWSISLYHWSSVLPLEIHLQKKPFSAAKPSLGAFS